MNLEQNFQDTKAASYALQSLSDEQIKAVLYDFADALKENTASILRENEKDLTKMEKDNPLYDRLLLTQERLAAIAEDVRKVAELPSPVGDIMDERILPNKAKLSRVRVPLGVVSAIYEARPNVTMGIFSLCFRTQNACILRGGTDAHATNTKTVSLIHDVLESHSIPESSVFLMPPEREHMPAMLEAHGLIDVCIPRGSQALIDYVRENAKIPVIETGRGVVHIYLDESADLKKAADIVMNAKTRRPSVCNSLDTLIVHQSLADKISPLMEQLCNLGVRINETPTEQDFDTEFLGLAMNMTYVDTMSDALNHIRRYGSGHTEAIVTEDQNAGEVFLKSVDASVVMLNASTAFSDGGEFGLGAEIGISTQKLHARGPMGLEPLTSYKWLLRGEGQIR